MKVAPRTIQHAMNIDLKLKVLKHEKCHGWTFNGYTPEKVKYIIFTHENNFNVEHDFNKQNDSNYTHSATDISL